MKKHFCLLLALLMLLSLCACAAKPAEDEEDEPAERHVSRREKDSTRAEDSASPVVTEAPPAAASHDPVPVDPESLSDDLTGFLARFGWVGRTDLNSYLSSNIDCVLPVMNRGFELIAAYDSYPGPSSSWTNTDPLGRWNGCHVYNAEKTDLILQTVYGVDTDIIDQLRAAGNDPFANFYYFDGSYYVTPLGVGGGFVCCPCYVLDDGVKLSVYYALYFGDGIFYPAGLFYAEVHRTGLDGHAVWALDYWSRTLPVYGMPNIGSISSVLGDWILVDDELSSLRIEKQSESYIYNTKYLFYVGFYRLVGFEAEAQLITDNGIAMFSACDGSGFQGWMEIGDDEIVLHIFASPEPDGYSGFNGYFDEHAFRFIRDDGTHTVAEPDFNITQEELEAEIERIRAVYYTPSDGDSHLSIPKGTDGWNYSREYYYHDGQLVFAFIYDGTQEHRLYFKDGHMIRYIDEHHTVYDFGALDPYTSWAERALEEAMINYAPAPVDPSAWLGVWVSDSGEWIQVTDADENGVSFVFHHSTELGTTDTEYTLSYLSADRRSVAEDESLIASGGWRYAFYLEDGCILVTSRYPDKYFYPHAPQ